MLFASPIRKRLLAPLAGAALFCAVPLLAAAQTTAPTSSLPASDRFSTAAAAAQHCPGDSVVWSSLSHAKVFHLSGSKYYGKTSHGAYLCEKEAEAAGYRAAKH